MPRQTKQKSRSVEDFIKAVYTLQQESERDEQRVSTNALARALSISAPSVTDMAQRLVDQSLVDYVKYYGVALSEKGEALALKIIRRHRLIELYLVQELGYKLHEVHDEADALEHSVSDRFVEAIAQKLNHPEFDPHGDPIPGPDGTLSRRNLQPLTDIPLHTPARVSRFISSNNEMLQHTLDQGFKLKLPVQVVNRAPFEGPVTVDLNGDEIIIGHTVAAGILVEMD